MAHIKTPLGDRVKELEYRTRAQEDDLRFAATQIAKKNDALVFDETNIGILFPDNDGTAEMYIIAQMPHCWAEGTPIYPHVHLILEKLGTTSFTMEYKWYNSYDQVPDNWSTYVMDLQVSPWASGKHACIVGNSTPIDGTGMNASSIIKIKVYRNETDTYLGDVLLDEFDIHYLVDSFGEDVQGDYSDYEYTE